MAEQNADYLILANMTSLNSGTFRERVEIAAEAGFDALGISLDVYRLVVETEMSAKEMKAVLEANGVSIRELEAVFGFAVDPAETGVEFGGGLVYPTSADVDEFFEIADHFGARHLQAVGAFNTDVLEPDVVERFAQLCDRAAPHDLKIALEFVPTTNIPDADTANRIVTESGRKNGGLCVDSWHHIRGSNDLDQLRRTPAENIVMVQINDGPTKPVSDDYLVDTLRYRQIPSEGEFDLTGFLQAVKREGSAPPISVEVISDAFREIEPATAADRLISGARRVLSETRLAQRS